MINVQFDFLFNSNIVAYPTQFTSCLLLLVQYISSAYNYLLITLPHLPLNLFTSLEQFELVNIIACFNDIISVTISQGYIILGCDIFIATAIILLVGWVAHPQEYIFLGFDIFNTKGIILFSSGKVAKEVLDAAAKVVGIALGSTIVYEKWEGKEDSSGSSGSSGSSNSDDKNDKDDKKKDTKKNEQENNSENNDGNVNDPSGSTK
jgi:hypothetical protein